MLELIASVGAKDPSSSVPSWIFVPVAVAIVGAIAWRRWKK